MLSNKTLRSLPSASDSNNVLTCLNLTYQQVLRAQGRYLGGVSVADGAAHPGHGLRRPHRHDLGHALGTGAATGNLQINLFIS